MLPPSCALLFGGLADVEDAFAVVVSGDATFAIE
jgi:hypothetical protein